MVVLMLSIPMVAQVVAAPLSARTEAEEVAVKEVVMGSIEACWDLLLDLDFEVERYYDMSSPNSSRKLARERERLLRHYLEPASEAGFRYTGVTVTADFTEVKVEETEARVTLTVDVEYTSEYPGDPIPIVTKEAGIEYTLQLVNRGGQWLVETSSYFDTFSKCGSRSPVNGIVEETNLQPALKSAGIQWYHYYDRSGAVTYADTWWNRRNPRYRSFSSDCANFVSQSFYEGGSALRAWIAPYVWWYNFNGTPSTSDDTWSSSWTVAHDQAYNLSRNTDVDEMRGTYVDSPGHLGLGDSVYYDFGGDGILDHSAIVVEIRNGQPYVNYHTTDTWHRHRNLNAVTTRFLRVTDWFWIN